MPHPKIHSVELETLVQDIDFPTFFSCPVQDFSNEEFTPSCYWFVEGVDGLWEWRTELARRGVVGYGKLIAKKVGLVSWEWHPDLANYRRVYNFDARWEESLAGYRKKRIMDVLLNEGLPCPKT